MVKMHPGCHLSKINIDGPLAPVERIRIPDAFATLDRAAVWLRPADAMTPDRTEHEQNGATCPAKAS
jgi:hypothetical protein